jgi:hypothetical protein
MSIFRDLYRRTAAPLNVRLFSETVTFFADATSTGVSRGAIVVRDELQIYQELGAQVGPAVICAFLDDAATGVLATSVNPEISQIEVALDLGLPAERRQVTRLLSADQGMTRVLVQ